MANLRARPSKARCRLSKARRRTVVDRCRRNKAATPHPARMAVMVNCRPSKAATPHPARTAVDLATSRAAKMAILAARTVTPATTKATVETRLPATKATAETPLLAARAPMRRHPRTMALKLLAKPRHPATAHLQPTPKPFQHRASVPLPILPTLAKP